MAVVAVVVVGVVVVTVKLNRGRVSRKEAGQKNE